MKQMRGIVRWKRMFRLESDKLAEEALAAHKAGRIKEL